ncbi:hypothetical protein NT6N_02340 [Oceaniferula spumae]|uniref:Methyltransferase domain-containing protein n=1 Tax=Oceaniferula spumae TaxID=2979115 RepID=A0AAT9FH13_9BACT
MRGHAWILNEVSAMHNVSKVVELGAGDGRLCNKVKTLLPTCEVTAVDLIPKPETVRSDIVWQQASIFEYDGFDRDTVVVANLFIHHLDDKELKLLGARLAQVRAVVLAEPHRKKTAELMGRLLFPLVNQVTRHDMITSIRAGFVKEEISKLIGRNFHWKESLGMFGGIRMIGVRG